MLFLLLLLSCPYAFCEDKISILMAGDTMLGQDTNKIQPKLFGNVLEVLNNQYNFKLFNFEGTIGDFKVDSNNPKCVTGKYCYKFMSPLNVLSLFKNINNGQIVFNIANNHSMDYGLHVQEQTYNIMKANGFGSIGASKNPIEMYEKNGSKIAIIGASPHNNTFSIFNNELLTEVIRLKKQGYIIIVSLHMGAEGEEQYLVKNHDEVFLGQNRGNIYKLAHKLVDLGVDVIMGHGPHVMRGIEIYKNKIIAYSLGNFLTYGNFSLQGKTSYGGLLSIEIEKNGDFFHGKFIGTQQLKSSMPAKWNEGVAIETSRDSMLWLKKISNENFRNTSIKFDNEGNLYK